MPPNRYFDNAATSFPKPPGVAAAMARYLDQLGGPYGRGAYRRAVEVSQTVEQTRDRLAERLGIGRPESLVFTPNATFAINLVLRGLLGKQDGGGGHVLVSPLEHNAVMRPLAALADAGVRYEVLPHAADGLVDVAAIPAALRPDTRLVVVNHQSNVNGLVQPIEEIKRQLGPVPLLVDAAQSAGCRPLEVDRWQVDYLALTGHKGLLGPPGIGGLFLRDGEGLEPLVRGGTGSRSASFAMPETLPDRFEAGTPNIVGIFGLLGALEGRPEPRHTREDLRWLCQQVGQITGLHLYAAAQFARQGGVLSICHARRDPAELGGRLAEQFGIETRVGLHCAPLAHRTLGTFPGGTVRIAPSVYHTRADFEYLLEALAEVARS